MTLEDLLSQNKRAWARIRELEVEIAEMSTLIADNLIKIADIQERDGNK